VLCRGKDRSAELNRVSADTRHRAAVQDVRASYSSRLRRRAGGSKEWLVTVPEVIAPGRYRPSVAGDGGHGRTTSRSYGISRRDRGGLTLSGGGPRSDWAAVHAICAGAREATCGGSSLHGWDCARHMQECLTFLGAMVTFSEYRRVFFLASYAVFSKVTFPRMVPDSWRRIAGSGSWGGRDAVLRGYSGQRPLSITNLINDNHLPTAHTHDPMGITLIITTAIHKNGNIPQSCARGDHHAGSECIGCERGFLFLCVSFRVCGAVAKRDLMGRVGLRDAVWWALVRGWLACGWGWGFWAVCGQTMLPASKKKKLTAARLR